MRLTLVFSLCTIIVDQITKWMAVTWLSSGETLPIIPKVFHLTLVYNRGVAFGFLNSFPWAVPLLVVTGCIFLLFLILHITKQHIAHYLMSGMLLGGAFGNIIDRIRIGAVIDFLDFQIWPVFNIADSCITIAAGMCIIFLLKEKA